jgi:alkylhydroperoxidase family enzyme
MFLLKTVTPGQAAGKVAEAYSVFPKEFGVPAPLQLMSASPELLAQRIEGIRYYMSHKKLTAPLLAAIRYLAASKANFPFCTELNGGLLMKMGMTAEETATLKNDPKASSLEPDEAAMLAFVAKALNDPASVAQDDIQALRDLGYADSDIFDALAHAANMTAGALLYKTFARE